MTARLLMLPLLLLVAASVHAQSERCPAPLTSETIAEACGIEGVEGDPVKADEEDCNWIYMRPGHEPRSLTVLRTTTGGTEEADVMSQLSNALGEGAGGMRRSLPDLGDGGQAATQTLPMIGTTHTVSFNRNSTFVEVNASGTPNLRGGDAADPFCTLDAVEALARRVAEGM